MLFSMEYYHVFLVMCISLCSSEDDGHKSPPSTGILCKSNEYYSIGLQRCLTCSVCPGKNLIIRKPCEKYSDTQCGPFIEFDKFHQSPIVNVLSSANVTRGKVLLTARIESTRSTNVPVEVIKDGRWYTLAMALVGVLCVVSFFVLLYIVLYCFVCKKRRNEKQLIYDPELHVSSVRSIPLIVRNSSPRTRYSDLPSRERLKKQVVTYTEEGRRQFRNRHARGGATIILHPDSVGRKFHGIGLGQQWSNIVVHCK
ncbi:hypothetical protein FSP39_006281 [Pinctada imbricata]|uniref:TNFR-Cys domain-containing protein n=1 Tax=Pinctada imbricata TaxID=66713 RepID=A0AA88YAY4_PINIB|nr:hypothetical protein FSP39_006281 [Pinctada imbricata]